MIVIIIHIPFHLPFAVHDIRVHGVVGVVQADVPGSHAMFCLLMKVDADIQAVVRRQTVIVALRYVTSGLRAAVGTDDDGSAFGYGDTAAGIEYPGDTCVYTFTELMVQAEADVVAAVIFIRKPVSLTDAAVGKTVFCF